MRAFLLVDDNSGNAFLLDDRKKINKETEGETVEVLEESENFGRTRDGFKVKWEGGGKSVGELRLVKIIEASDFLLIGEKIK